MKITHYSLSVLVILFALPFASYGKKSHTLNLQNFEKVMLDKNTEPLQAEHVKNMQQNFDQNPHYKHMQNAVTVTEIQDLALNRFLSSQIDDSFSHKLDDWSVTNQKSTGRCWMFAGLNLLRVSAMQSMNIKDFEFSQNYIFFWDKIERANYFLEAIINTADRPHGDRVLDFLLDHCLSDGGQWNMFTSLIKKYGLVPKTAMPESQSSSNSRWMNNIVRAKLHESAKHLRDLHIQGADLDDLRKTKNEILSIIYRILSIHLGTPPEDFYWQWRDKDNEFHRDGVMTPQEFARKYLTLDIDQYVCLVHDPRPTSPFGRTFTVAYLGNVIGGDPILYLNVEMSLLKELAMRTIVDEQPVWFGCDVGKQMSSKLGLWDSNLLEYEGIYHTRFDLAKADRLIYHQTRMTHAMLFTGVDVLDENPRRWRVENSWGKDSGQDGFFIMNDSWFDEYVFEVALQKSYLPEQLKEALEIEPIALPPWDPMGALACQEIMASVVP